MTHETHSQESTQAMKKDLDYSLLEGPMPKPKAGFQTLWVQKQLKKLKARTEALKAQFIKPNEIL